MSTSLGFTDILTFMQRIIIEPRLLVFVLSGFPGPSIEVESFDCLLSPWNGSSAGRVKTIVSPSLYEH